ncbi:DUF2415 domain-containing protein [Collinsella sp. AM16-21]|nr:DUF2415 domain-containing protein [Collinsella sp. AM44-11]RHI13756.1 DUF2415 domain-containing protein [Collinsella sp. AM16-21]
MRRASPAARYCHFSNEGFSDLLMASTHSPRP